MRSPSRHGQSAVETLLAVPGLVLVGIAAWWLAAGALMWLQTGSAARAGARADAVGTDAGAAARAVLGGHRARVAVLSGAGAVRRVRVTVTVPAPFGAVAVPVSAEAEAYAP